MKIVVFASRKGGTGKSTLAINIAVLASKRGATCLIDMDPQGSIGAWHRMREQAGRSEPKIEACDANELRKLVSRLDRNGCRLVCIDTPPTSGPAVRAALQIADYIVIPVRPDLVNFHAVTDTIEMAREYKKPYVVVINEAPPLRDGEEAPLVRTARAQVGRAAVQALYSQRIWKRQITHRLAIPYALNRGLAVSEVAPDEPCAREIESFWTTLNRTLARTG